MIFSKTHTDYFLEFFPYASTLGAGAEGYVKASTGQLNVFYNYVYTYTDHLGNIRLKYTTHPQTGETTILEEDHYYPYGLTHATYASHHLTIGLEEPGADITLIEVTPDVSDPHKYKFNGMEYQDEFDVNLYVPMAIGIGARNGACPERSRGNPTIVRTLTPDPLGEAFYHLSPYSFLNNNPMSNIDPTGALTLTGQAAKDWFQGLKDDIASKPRKRKEDEDEDDVDDINYDPQSGVISTSNASVYQSFFQGVGDYAANADVSLGGGCPDGDCGGEKKTEENNPKPRGGRYQQLSAGFAFGGGFGIAIGKVYDSYGNSKWYFNFDGNIGFGADWSLDAGVIESTGDHSFIVNDFGGNSGSYNVGLTFWGMDASYHKGGSLEKNWSGRKKINPLYFGKTDKEGYRTKQGGVGRGTGFRAGGYYSYGTTKVFN